MRDSVVHLAMEGRRGGKNERLAFQKKGLNFGKKLVSMRGLDVIHKSMVHIVN